jgi:hypothetical protein
VAGKRQRLKSGFTLGGEAAEADPLLEKAFFDSSDYEVIISKSDHRCFVVGRTGAGKSAALQRLEDIDPDHVIRINPENLSLPYITNLQAIRYLDSLEINLDTFWNTLWKHVLIVEIMRHRYNVTSADAKTNAMQTLMRKLKTDRTKQAALAYLEEFEGRFWCETDERVREITDKFTERLGSDTAIKAGVAGASANVSGSSMYESATESKAEQVARFQRIVNENQLARLNKMVDVLDDNILESPNDFRYVIIDDLDQEWVDERIANDLIRCLFQTVYGLQHVRNLKVLVALRTNIFQELDFGRRGAGQEEKFRALVLDMRWTRPDLESLLDERVAASASNASHEARTMKDLLPAANNTMGKPVDYILDRTLLRPRDAIAFANECLAVGIGKGRLSWDDIKTAERMYSSKRLLALRDEWKGTYSGIDRVIEKFRRCDARIAVSDFTDKLNEVAYLLAESDFEGTQWLTELANPIWNAHPRDAWTESYHPLIRTLYNIGLIGVSTRPSGRPQFSADHPNLLEHEGSLRQVEFFYIHRTYQAGLEIKPQRDR